MYKHDYEPLLSAGRHEMTPAEFEARFVIGLGGVERPKIWQRFKTDILSPLQAFDIKCELWLDGSFVTKCPEPKDIDGSLMILSEVVSQMSDESFNYLNNFDDYNSKLHETLDFFLCQVYPKGHDLRDDMNDPDGWAEWWSSERNSGWLKGFVVIPFR